MIKKGRVLLATQGKKTSHYAPLDNNTKQYTKKVFFLNYVLFCTTAKVITVYSYFEKLVRKNVYATIPKGYMGYDQYPVPDSVAVTVHGLL